MGQKRFKRRNRGGEQKGSMEGEDEKERGAIQDKWERDEMKWW